jgi:hypothetical protein
VVSFSGALEASAGRRQALKRLVTTHGGRIVYILSKQVPLRFPTPFPVGWALRWRSWYQVTHLVVGEEDVDELLRQQQQDQLVDSRVRKAQELGLQVVSDRWLLDSVAARTLLDDIPYSPLVSRVSCRVVSCRVVSCRVLMCRVAGTRSRGSNACCCRD